MKSGPTVRRRIHACQLGALLCLGAVGLLQAKDDPGKGLRFGSPQVLDLSSSAKVDGASVPVTALSAGEAAKILAAPTIGEDGSSLLFSDDVYSCKPPSTSCSQLHERKLIDAAGDSVRRDGKRLTLSPRKGAPLVFVDWKDKPTKNADGDEETHWYLGRLDGSGYQRVEVQFGQDAPGDFLINPANGKVAFVHNGADVAEPAHDGRHLVTFNTSNPPLSIRVAALDATGPRVQMQCVVGKDADHVTGHFKGWHDAQSFDIALTVGAANSKLERTLPLHLVLGEAGWSVATPDPAKLGAIRFVCRSVGQGG